MAATGDQGHGGGFALGAFWFVMAVLSFVVAISTIGYFLERYGAVDVVREDPPPRQREFRGVVPPAAPSASAVPTTAHSTRIGPPAPAAPLPGYDKSSACNDPRAERRINPETGNRSCFVPD